MNKILLTLAFMFSCVACIFAQGELPEETVDYAANFATFAGVVGVTAVVTEFIKKLFKVEPSEWVQRIISWVIGIGLGMFAWGFNLGMFEGLDWWQALLWGFGAGLASNGVFDSGLIEWLFGLFTKKKEQSSSSHFLFLLVQAGRKFRLYYTLIYTAMTIDEKYTKLKSIFFKDFVVVAENYNCRGTNIPASKVTKSNTTGQKILYWGDGTINIAEYLHYLYVEAVLGYKSCVDKIYWCLKSIERLSLSVYEDEKMKNPKVYFKYEPGFFLRDDISVNSKDLFDAFKVESGYSNGIELINEDPCFSPFVSQDQIWNLLPSLALIAEGMEDHKTGILAKEILKK